MLFNRVVKLYIKIGNIIKEFDERYKIDFDITKSTGGTYDSGNIVVTGLSSSDVAAISTNYNYENKILRPNDIILIAGYKSNVASIIFKGSAIEAVPQLDTADKSISFECTTGYNMQIQKVVAVNYKSVLLSVVCTEIAANFNVPCLFYATDRELKNYTYRGSLYNQIQGLRNMEGINIEIFFDGSSLRVQNSELPGAMMPLICNSSTGMIGTPRPSFLGCDVKMLLQPMATPGQKVIVTSKMIPTLSKDTYRAMNIRHTGSSRDSYFYTEIECTRFGVNNG